MSVGRSPSITLGKARQGFTLVEMLIAIGLVMVLLGSVLSFWAYVSAGVGRLNERMEQQHGVRVFLERLEREVTSSLVGYASLGGGVKGDASSLRLLVRSVDVAGAVTSAADATGTKGDLQEVSYRFEGGRLSISMPGAGRSPLTRAGPQVADENEASSDLLPGAQPPADSTAPRVSDGGLIARDVGLIRFRYHDGSQWTDAFDSWAAGRLPAAIEVSVWYRQIPQPESSDTAFSPGSDFNDLGIPDDQPFEPGLAGDDDFAMSDTPEELPPPDLVRLFIVPDGPTYEPGRSFEDVEEGSIEAADGSDPDSNGEDL